ncbi:helix-turn-helix transcriptional regulator [Actibacterium pelagium]|uniref:Transcriptional regulator, AlpA family n=1 Tax=Actibacterium pelagium TaxID=2029103 RepID=A0A917AJI1_9RHOB|nr:AlpA family phage regulatory protein [Actibacterium pelagium]GGE57480.1 hypothetical protein GCM10011517_26580 [Actibacterium pelagium]
MRLLTFKELGEILGGRSRSSIYRDVEKGRLPKPVHLGGRVYWRSNEVEEFLGGLASAN